MKSIAIRFPGRHGHELAARLEMPSLLARHRQPSAHEPRRCALRRDRSRRVGRALRRARRSDCSECETREGKVDRIERVVELEGALDDAQRAKLLEIASKFPVHRTLHSEVSVPTRLG